LISFVTGSAIGFVPKHDDAEEVSVPGMPGIRRAAREEGFGERGRTVPGGDGRATVKVMRQRRTV